MENDLSTTILGILNLVAADNSRLTKERILNENKDNQVLKDVFRLAYDRQIMFFTRQIPDEKNWAARPGGLTLAEALDILENVVFPNRLRGGENDRMMEDLFARLYASDAEVLKRVILRDLRIGATSSTANKVWPDLITKVKFMLCSTESDKIVYPALSQIKEDGTRAKFIFDGDEVLLLTRAGNDITTHGVFTRWAKERLQAGDILDGELVAFEGGKRMNRQTSNGIVNKAVKGTISQEEADKLTFIMWDIETRPCDEYHTRYSELEQYDNFLGNLEDKDKVVLVETRWVYNYEEALEHFKEARRRGLEGTILKNKSSLWEPKRSKELVKFKAEHEGEFKVVGVEEGRGKNKGRLGALLIESADGLVACDVGIFKDVGGDKIRDEWWKTPPKIVTVRYNERINSKGSTKQKLFLPRVIAERLDKTEADTVEQLEAMEKATIV